MAKKKKDFSHYKPGGSHYVPAIGKKIYACLRPGCDECRTGWQKALKHMNTCEKGSIPEMPTMPKMRSSQQIQSRAKGNRLLDERKAMPQNVAPSAASAGNAAAAAAAASLAVTDNNSKAKASTCIKAERNAAASAAASADSNGASTGNVTVVSVTDNSKAASGSGTSVGTTVGTVVGTAADTTNASKAPAPWATSATGKPSSKRASAATKAATKAATTAAPAAAKRKNDKPSVEAAKAKFRACQYDDCELCFHFWKDARAHHLVCDKATTPPKTWKRNKALWKGSNGNLEAKVRVLACQYDDCELCFHFWKDAKAHHLVCDKGTTPPPKWKQKKAIWKGKQLLLKDKDHPVKEATLIKLPRKKCNKGSNGTAAVTEDPPKGKTPEPSTDQPPIAATTDVEQPEAQGNTTRT